jgi:hypothetical protein
VLFTWRKFQQKVTQGTGGHGEHIIGSVMQQIAEGYPNSVVLERSPKLLDRSREAVETSKSSHSNLEVSIGQTIDNVFHEEVSFNDLLSDLFVVGSQRSKGFE